MSDAQDFLRRVFGDFFDVHAARFGGNDRNAAALAIQRERQIDLAFDVRTRLDVDRFDGQPFRTGLFGHQPLTQHVGRGRAHRVQISRQFHAASLAASAGMDLGLDDPEFAA